MADNQTDTAETGISFERLVLFSDAVFAIVITLLVLPLTSEVEIPEDATDLFQEVVNLWPRIQSFVLGFLVVGQFWIAHHRMFGHLRNADLGLLWLNLLILLTVSFMPFPTALLGTYHGDDRIFQVAFYAASMSAISILLSVTWFYAVRRRLVDPAMTPAAIREVSIRGYVTAGLMVLSIGAAFFGLYVAVVFWLVLIPLARVLLTRRRRSAVRTG